MAELENFAVEAITFGGDLLTSMGRKPGSCKRYSFLRKKIGINLKPKGRFYGLDKLADKYLSELQKIHYPLCTAFDGVDPRLRGTMHP